ncbi:DUF3344 domain-containing protein [Methanosarcina horonobensis]|uniref:DUF3344 domain-containing protein n=1 Tax=Methanosarcina horonobensis TaxID=418008 RepID=UPI00130195B8|nr:DUF3344 domain-containing protein [Methanosarcina horonobensis]
MLPAAADYTADKPLTEIMNGMVTGGMNYTIGNSSYSPKLWNYNSTTSTGDSFYVQLQPGLPDGATNHSAKLYVYYTWSYLNDTNSSSNTGMEANMNVVFNGLDLGAPTDHYTDQKEASGYDYPSGTCAYDVTSYVDATDPSKTYVVKVTNAEPYNGDDGDTDGDDKCSFNIQAVGLLTLYNQSGGTNKYYYIDEGCDVTYVKWTGSSWTYGIKPSDAQCVADFTNVNTNNVESATLTTVVPSGGTPYNKLYFNSFSSGSWEGLWNANPYADFSWTTTDVTSYLATDNEAKMQNGLNDNNYNTDTQMQAANAFLLVNTTTT